MYSPKQTDILTLLHQGETSCLEAKKAEKNIPATLWESYSAFCNTDGGVILLGVSENVDGKLFVSGVEDSVKIIKTFWDQINNKQRVNENLLFNHHVYPVEIEGKEIVVVEVPRADRHNKPVYINDDLFRGTYRRNADGDYHCRPEEIKAMLRDQSDISSDSRIADKVKPEELDMDSVHRYRMRFSNLKPSHGWNALGDMEFLLKAGALKRNRDTNEIHPTMAGILMFGTEMLITEQFPDYFLDYREIEKGNRWTDRVISSSGDWSGNLFDFYFKIIDRLTSGVKTPFRLQNGLNRMDDTLVHQALREALANAVIHADYQNDRGIVVEKSKDRLLVSNPGSLRITPDEAMEGGISDPRNALLFKMFILINVGERAGSGLHNIYYIWNLLGLLPPILTEQLFPDRLTLEVPFTNGDTISLYNVADEALLSEELAPPATPPATPPAGELLTDLEERFLSVISENKAISRTQLAEHLEIGLDTVKEYLRKLREKGYLERVGGNTSAGRWKLLK